MNAILLKTKLLPNELYRLLTEFPQYKLLMATNDDATTLTKEQCSQVEVIYGDHLNKDELQLLPQLRWIHVPTPYLESLCMPQIQQQGNILISTTKEENIEQIGEFALSGMLAFAKNLFQWHDADYQSLQLKENQWKESMWTTTDRTLLQVGLGMIGTEIARRGKQMGLHVIGIQDPPSFHPYCREVHPMKELDRILPSADIVCLSWPRDHQGDTWFRKREMDLMKPDSALLVFGSGSVIDLEDLSQPEIISKLRGVLLDARFFSKPIPPESALWQQRNVLITPEAAVYPKTPQGQAFRAFLYNLRQFLPGNFSDMKNLVNQGLPLIPSFLGHD